VEYAPPARTPFDWLRDPDQRGSALRQIEFALARGWLDPTTADVAPLKDTLTELIVDPSTSAAQSRRMQRVLAVLGPKSLQPRPRRERGCPR
jgi:hypothetical protein